MNGTKQITIPAAVGGVSGVYFEKTTGATVFYVVAATHSFTLRAGNESRVVELEAGDKHGSAGGKKFGTITLYNSTATAIVITAFIGDKDFSEQKFQVETTVNTLTKNAPTYTKATNGNVVGGGDTIEFSGLDGDAVRKQIAISNGDAESILQIVDADGNIGQFIQPLQTWTMETSGTIILKNPNGGDVSFAALETFYEA